MCVVLELGSGIFTKYWSRKVQRTRISSRRAAIPLLLLASKDRVGDSSYSFGFKVTLFSLHLFLQMFARMTGPFSKDIATEKYPLVIRGAAVRGHVLHWEPISPVFTVKKKMYISKVFTAENSLGWASLISTLKGNLCGAMEHRLTSITGRSTSQITSTMRTVFILLVFFKITITNGMMSIAQTVTDSLARKASLRHLIRFDRFYLIIFLSCQ